MAARCSATARPFGTVTLRHDRALPFDTGALAWAVGDWNAPVNQASIPAELSAAAASYQPEAVA